MKIKTLFANRSRWTKRAFARDSRGLSVLPRDEDAVKFCLMGALEKCYPSQVLRLRAETKLRSMLSFQQGRSLMVFNDTSTFIQVRALVTKANV